MNHSAMSHSAMSGCGIPPTDSTTVSHSVTLLSLVTRLSERETDCNVVVHTVLDLVRERRVHLVGQIKREDFDLPR